MLPIDLDEMEDVKKRVWKSVSGGMPEKFKAVLLEFSKADLFEDAIEEWLEVGGQCEISHTCICSHEINNCYYVHNMITGKRLVIGSKCIKKFGTEDMKKTMNMRKSIRSYEGDRQPCLHCGTHSKAVSLLYCRKCMEEGNTTVSRVIMEEFSGQPCWGDCGKKIFHGRRAELPYCNECFVAGECQSCAESMVDNARCFDCYEKRLPIKCSVPECWVMISYSEGKSKRMCKGCSVARGQTLDLKKTNLPKREVPKKVCTGSAAAGSQVFDLPTTKLPVQALFNRVCANKKCGKELPADTPSYYSYCCWSCKQGTDVQYVSSVSNARKCCNAKCGKVLPSTTPSHHKYCSWSCRNT